VVGVIDHGKRNVLGVLVDAVDYPAALLRVLDAAHDRRPYGVSALAVHGVMIGVRDDVHRHRLNALDLVTPDGQPVRWALNWLHGTKLTDRVYGPELTRRLYESAAAESLPVYFYGSTPAVLCALRSNLRHQFPTLAVAGAEPSRFRRLTITELDEVAERIRASGARMTFVGLGCPRQEVFAYELRGAVRMPVIAVGAAFDYHAGLVGEPPRWIQDWGLQWAYRLIQNPTRLWRRYLLLNPQYLARLLAQKVGLWRPDPGRTACPTEVVGYG
jgi:N-acetylglucosaminyldiphosphoundecaprenol N-acetyl-beta-D-mannosaminyltransferase